MTGSGGVTPGPFVKEIPQGTAERIYAADFLRYRLRCADTSLSLPPDRPDVREYNLGVRVTDHLREEIDRILDGA
jgi:hypothetical protein